VLLSGHPVNLAELATNTATDATALAAALTTAGICTELTPALAAGYHYMITTRPEAPSTPERVRSGATTRTRTP
jgi:hypothetical protein